MQLWAISSIPDPCGPGSCKISGGCVKFLVIVTVCVLICEYVLEKICRCKTIGGYFFGVILLLKAKYNKFNDTLSQ